MKKILKPIISFIITIMCVVSMQMPLLAETETLTDSNQKVFDYMGLFSEDEIIALEGSIKNIEEKIETDIVILTVYDAEGKTSNEYADDYYDNGGFREDGVLFSIDMDNREIAISTAGDAIRYLSDERIESILDSCYDGIVSGDYYTSANSFISSVEQDYAAGIADEQYNYDTESGEVSKYRHITIMEALVFGIISIAVGVGICFIVLARYQLKFSQYKYPLRDRSEVNINHNEDVFLSEYTTAHRIAHDRPSGGGGSIGGGGMSSTHTSSGGTSHGGGSRGF